MERDIEAWKNYMRTRGELSEEEIDELEEHLRDTINDLVKSGLSGEEAFIIGVKRTGKVSSVAAEYSKVHGKRLWKQLFLEPADREDQVQARREVIVVVVLALAAGLLSRVPELFGIRLFGEGTLFYVRNLSFLVLPAVAGYFIWKYPRRAKQAAIFFVICAFSVLLANLYPVYASGSFDILIGIHVSMLLWISIGVVYAGTGWRNMDGRMDFIRFTGEMLIYLVLTYLGGAVLVFVADLLFAAIGLNADVAILQYFAVIGGCAAPVVAAYLATSKRNIIENMAPVLARVFSPLFLLLFVVFLVAMISTGSVLSMDRDVLIGFDLLLALVFGMVLYTISARGEREEPGLNDYLQAALIVAALAVDIIALAAILVRINDFGFTPNKTAALGENIILFVNLAVSLLLYLRFFRQRDGFRALLAWQTKFLPLFAVWAAAVAFLFPVIFKTGYSL